MHQTAHAPSVGSPPAGLRRLRLFGLLAGLLAMSTPAPASAQDPVTGRWFATIEDAVGSSREVFVLEADGDLVRGHRVLRGSDGLEVRGRREGQRVRLEFQVPEGRSSVRVVIEAEAFQDRMTGTWTAVLPTGQQVERVWRAERTRAGSSNRPGGAPQ